jgi:hypothetical protein
VGGDVKSVIHSHRPNSPSDGDDLVFGGSGNDWVDGGNGNNLLNSGPGLSETLIAGSGNDIALINTNRAARFVIDLDGGHNLVIRYDFNKQPAVPFEVCDRVTFGQPIIPVVNGHVLQPGKVPGVPDSNPAITRKPTTSKAKPNGNLMKKLVTKPVVPATSLVVTNHVQAVQALVRRGLARKV